jgi:flagellin-like hook-associated protein FlgL
MANLVPIPTSRVSNAFVRQRLLAQLQGDQLDVFRLQNQVSTGRRISRPSEDAPAAQRAITLQRLIERKTQLASNVSTGRSFLAETDRALADVSTELGNLRGAAIGVAGTTSSEGERDAVIAQVDGAIEFMLGVANKQFRGRYLFAGSQTNLQPYSRSGNSILYAGNEKTVDNFSDIDMLFATSAPGANVFGGISEVVLGGTDLNPHLSADTLLSSLRGGRGISQGAVQVSDGTNTEVVDLSGAVTVGDVVRLLEENPPAGRAVSASITATGLTLQLDASGGGNLTVSEVGSGTTASELGILETNGVLTNPLVGSDVDPVLRRTTRVADLFGSKARARLDSAGDNNDLLIEAAANGAAFNGVTVQLVNDVGAGAEYAQYAAGTLTIHIEAGASTANAVAGAINTEGTYTATLDPTDTANPAQAGTGLATVTATAVTAGGGGTSLDLASGLLVQNGGQSYAISFAGAETVEDLLNRLNGSDAGLYATINAAGTGINVRSRLSGSDFQIGENGGTTATQLGLRTYSRDLRLDDLNFGVGVPTNVDLNYNINKALVEITTGGGTVFNVDLTGAATVTDVINAINLATGASVTAQASGGGIRFIDNTAGSGALSISQSGANIPFSGGIPVEIEAPDFSITTRSGQVFNINLNAPETIGDVIDAINAVTGASVTARLATVGNGIELVDNTVGAGQLTIGQEFTSQAAEHLGLIPLGSTQAASTTGTIVGADRNLHESASVFTTLVRLREALASGDENAINRAIALIDGDVDRAAFARAEVGAREQALEISQRNLEDEDVQLQSALSNEIEVDLVEAISNLTARQVSLQASLQTMANILRLSLLDYF